MRHYYVYFARLAECELIKIGKTGHAGRRLGQLRREYGQDFEYLTVARAGPCTERTLHFVFRAQRVVGEWFQPTQHLLDLIEYVDSTGEVPLYELVNRYPLPAISEGSG